MEGVPVAQATLGPLACVGIPLDDDSSGRQPLLPPVPPSSYGGEEAMVATGGGSGGRGAHGDVNLGVGRDMSGAEEAARASARRDNLAFNEMKG